MDKRDQRFFCPSKKSSVSSEYWNCEIGVGSFQTRKPLMRFCSSPVLKILLNASTTKVKRKGNKGSPCLTRRVAAKKPQGNCGKKVKDPV